MTSIANGSVEPRYQVGGWIADPRACTLRRDDVEKKLNPRAMEVLTYFAHRPGDAVTHDELLQAFWRGPVSSPNAVHKTIAELRRAFEEDGACIETIPKRGYRLIAAVETLQSTNGAHHSENGAKQPNVVSSTEVEPTNNGIATIQRRSRRSSIWIGAGALVVVIAAIASIGIGTVTSFVVRIDDKSAVLLPPPSSMVSTKRRAIEAVRDNVVARFRTTEHAHVDIVHHLTWMENGDENPAAWNADYAVQIDLSEGEGKSRASLSIVPATLEDPSHHEEFEVPSDDRFGLRDTLAFHVTEDLAVLLDKDRVAQMRQWGTSNVDAYRLAREGDTFQRIHRIESQHRAAELFRQSIEVDRSFAYAYLSLASIYTQLMVTPADTDDRERIRLAMQELAREGRAATLDSSAITKLDRRYETMSAGNAFDAEEQWRAELTKNPKSFEGSLEYSHLLVGAKLYDEGRQYLERARILSKEVGANFWTVGSVAYYAPIAESEGDFETAIRVMKDTNDRYPDGTAPLFGLVRALAKVGKFAEAETYLARLQRTDEMWAFGASVWLATLRGDIALESAALREAFAHPLMTNATRGAICFILGDVESGVRWWREMEPAYVPIYWQFGPTNEIYWAPGVLTDPRYRALVDSMGWGSLWRAHMRKMAAELTPITGIEVTSPLPHEDQLNIES